MKDKAMQEKLIEQKDLKELERIEAKVINGEMKDGDYKLFNNICKKIPLTDFYGLARNLAEKLSDEALHGLIQGIVKEVEVKNTAEPLFRNNDRLKVLMVQEAKRHGYKLDFNEKTRTFGNLITPEVIPDAILDHFKLAITEGYVLQDEAIKNSWIDFVKGSVPFIINNLYLEHDKSFPETLDFIMLTTQAKAAQQGYKQGLDKDERLPEKLIKKLGLNEDGLSLNNKKIEEIKSPNRLSSITDFIKDSANTTINYIRENPWKSAGMAVGALVLAAATVVTAGTALVATGVIGGAGYLGYKAITEHKTKSKPQEIEIGNPTLRNTTKDSSTPSVSTPAPGRSISSQPAMNPHVVETLMQLTSSFQNEDKKALSALMVETNSSHPKKTEEKAEVPAKAQGEIENQSLEASAGFAAKIGQHRISGEGIRKSQAEAKSGTISK
ncbi:hypothetical protein H1Q59_02855 [Holosporaceae bacterium 'Namur']|nr:hypothetical protein [Holosporaceae bacterium 'Namur']